ncbi:MAG: hypothetical protein RSA00_01325 [Hydrogenoanaerobacterium sp.]
MHETKSLLKAPKISGNKLSPRFSDTIEISSKDQTELIRHIAANGKSYLLRSIFKTTAKSPLENMASWINLDLKK